MHSLALLIVQLLHMDAVDESPVERAILVFQLFLDERNGRTADDQHRVAVLQKAIDEMLED